MCLKYSGCVQRLSSPHLCCLLFPSKSSALCVSPLGVYDEDSQWMIQVNRLQKLIDRLEQKVTSFFSPNTSRPLFPAFFFFFLLQVLLFLSLSVSSHHASHLVFTSLSQINHKSHNNINKLPQLNNTLPRTNTYTYVEYTGNMRLSELLSARVECSMKSVVNQHVIKCLRAPTMV